MIRQFTPDGTNRITDSFVRKIPVVLTEPFAALPDKQKGWEGFLRRTPPALDPPPLPELLADLRAFLGPVIRVLACPKAPGELGCQVAAGGNDDGGPKL